jgi:serine protease Do
MKTNPLTTIAAGIAALLTAPAFAIEAPEDDAPPPAAPAPAAEQAPAEEAPKPAEKEPIAFLGVLANELPEMLAEHTGLENGEGVVVSSLDPEGPAAKAGLAVNDIITKLDGKPINSQDDLTREVRAHKPGEKARLDIIHKGKPAGIDVTLGVRPDLGGIALKRQPLDNLRLEGVPQEMAERIRKALEGNAGGMHFDIGRGDPKQLEDAVDQMRKRMEKALEGMDAKIVPGAEIKQQANIRIGDRDGSVELHSKDGNKEATVRDHENNIVWTGPWETEQDKAAAPADVRKRIERLNIDQTFKGNGIRLQLNGGFQLGEPAEEEAAPGE